MKQVAIHQKAEIESLVSKNFLVGHTLDNAGTYDKFSVEYLKREYAKAESYLSVSDPKRSQGEDLQIQLEETRRCLEDLEIWHKRFVKAASEHVQKSHDVDGDVRKLLAVGGRTAQQQQQQNNNNVPSGNNNANGTSKRQKIIAISQLEEVSAFSFDHCGIPKRIIAFSGIKNAQNTTNLQSSRYPSKRSGQSAEVRDELLTCFESAK